MIFGLRALIRLNLETAVRDGKLMQDLELESLCNGVGHSQRVLDHPTANDSGSRDCVKLPSPTAVFRLNVISLLLLIVCQGCKSSDKKEMSRGVEQKGEYIFRKDHENIFPLAEPQKREKKAYPWDKILKGNHPSITKEFFRCKGSSLHPNRIIEQPDGLVHWQDCGGVEKHSLPLREGKEFVYPILIDLLNYIQDKTCKKVVITCGHRCPQHNTYVDESYDNHSSKHTIGAEVSFYVLGLEEQPEVVVKHIQEYYKENSTYQALSDYKEYLNFHRYEKQDTNVSTLPWYNKEVFVKIFNKNEGRNFDHRHFYPFVSIQVRYDREKNEKVTYSWDKAHRNYHRW